MKKFSLLVALALLITVSGVYATWTYTDAADDIWDVSREALVQLETATTDGAAGTYNIETNLRLYIDQVTNLDSTTEHKAQLLLKGPENEEPHLTITFTPANGATADVKQNAIPTELYFKTSEPIQFKFDNNGRYDEEATEKDIFEFSNLADGKFNAKENPTAEDLAGGKIGAYKSEAAIQWGPAVDGKFTVTFDKDDLEEMITLKQEFYLDSKAEYDAFNTMLTGKTIIIGVTDGTVNTGTAG